ncbi:protein disulfide isomerase-like 1-5 [Iris pallida]|uniref:protein disulfide-isomerase n=1 Tax=Iris pallida TaxID=29817 RepID=A0AAX6HBV7_IRIPA|nr:protein disulfide isomerase-like 1-5 [Iris pallida]
MSAPKPTPKLLLLFFLLLLSNPLIISATDDDDDLEELLAIDAEEEERITPAASHADAVSRAQTIVLELTNENAQKAVADNAALMVLGYAPWCARSAELMPRFAEAAAALRGIGSPVVAAKLDADRHGRAAGALGIRGFPTLLLFVNGSARTYSGGFTGDEIVIWARKKTGDSVMRLSSKSAAEEFLKRHQIYIVGLFEKYEGTEYEEFIKASSADNEIQFVEVNDISIAEILFPDIGSVKQFLGLVKSEPERFERYEDNFQQEKILQFIAYNKFALVSTLTDLNSARLYASPLKIQVFIFAEADDFEHLLLPIQEVARKFKSKIMFVYVDSTDDNLAKPFLTMFGLEPGEPIVTGFDNRIGSKYLLESDPTPSNLDKFCSGMLHGTLSPYFKSEPKPNPDADGMIQKVVGRTFDASVLNSIENVLLEVYTPWCVDCEATSKQVEKLAKHFKAEANLKFARIDASLNEHPKLEVNYFPTLLFYPAGDKANPIKLPKKSSLKELAAIIKGNIKITDDTGVSTDQPKDEL